MSTDKQQNYQKNGDHNVEMEEDVEEVYGSDNEGSDHSPLNEGTTVDLEELGDSQEYVSDVAYGSHHNGLDSNGTKVHVIPREKKNQSTETGHHNEPDPFQEPGLDLIFSNANFLDNEMGDLFEERSNTALHYLSIPDIEISVLRNICEMVDTIIYLQGEFCKELASQKLLSDPPLPSSQASTSTSETSSATQNQPNGINHITKNNQDIPIASDINTNDNHIISEIKSTQNTNQNIVTSSSSSSPSSADTSMIPPLLLLTTNKHFNMNHKSFIYKSIPNFVKALMEHQSVTGDIVTIVNEFFEKVIEMISNELLLCDYKTFSSLSYYAISKEQYPQVEDQMQLLSYLIEILQLLFDAKNSRFYQNGLYCDIDSKNYQKDFEKYSSPVKNAEWWSNGHKNNCIASPPYVKNPKHLKNVSYLLVKNVNLLGKYGGFKILMEWILYSNRIDPDILILILTLLNQIIDVLVPKVHEDIFSKIPKKITDFVHSLDEDALKRYDKNVLTDLVQCASEVLSRSMSPQKAAEFQEITKLDINLQFIHSKSLDKKFQGIANLKAMMKDIQEEENRKANKYFASASPSNSKFLTMKLLLKWIDDNQFLECLFKDIHPEVIRQSRAIILCLATTRDLKESEIDLIWKASVGKHEATQGLIYNFIVDLLPSLKISNINSFFEHVESMPLSMINEITLRFIRDFTIEAVISSLKLKDKKKKWYGLELFWLLIGEDSSIPTDIAKKSLDCLIELLERQEFEIQRKKFMKLCAENIKKMYAVPQSMILLQRIINTHSKTPKKKKGSVYYAIEYLQDKYKLLDVLFDELIFWRDSFLQEKGVKNNQQDDDDDEKGEKNKKMKQQSTQSEDNNDISRNAELPQERNQIRLSDIKNVCHGSENTATNRQYTLKEHIEIRLDFLEFILHHSGLTISFDQAQKMWKVLYENQDIAPLDPNIIRSPCIGWFAKARKKEAEYFSDGVPERFFNDILLHLNPTIFDSILFNLFFTFFIWINSKQGKLLESIEEVGGDVSDELIEIGRVIIDPTVKTIQIGTTGTKKMTKYFVKNHDLSGLDMLWNIVLLTSHEQVAQKAIKFLNNFKHDYISNARVPVASLRDEYMKSCIQKLSDLSQKLNQKNNEDSTIIQRQIIRCLDLLMDFVNLFYEKGGIRGHGVRSAGFPIKLRICVIDGSKYRKTFQSNEKVSKISHYISGEINHPVAYMKLYTLGREIIDIEKTLEDMKVKDNQVVLVKKLDFKDVGLDLLNFQLKALGLSPVADALSKTMVETYQHRIKNLDDGNAEKDMSLPSVEESGGISVNNDDDESTYPTRILARDDYFHILLSLLDLNDQIAQKSWNLILHLPTNENMSQMLRTTIFEAQGESMKWEELIPTKSIHKLLYTLQIIDLNIKQQKNSKMPGFDLCHWSKQFISTGGLSHLINILLESESIQFTVGSIHKECFALLLKIINSFISTHVSEHLDYLPSISKIQDKLLQLAPNVVLQNNNRSSSSTTETPQTINLGQSNATVHPHASMNRSVFMEARVVEEMITLLNTAIGINYSHFEQFINHPALKSFIKNSLLICDYKEIRQEVSKGLLRLFSENEGKDRNTGGDIAKSDDNVTRSKAAKAKFVKMIVEFIPSIKEYQHDKNCEQFFMLLRDLCAEPLDDINEKKYLTDFISMILKRPITEEREDGIEDKVLVGLLNVSQVLLRHHESMKVELGSRKYAGLINEIFHSFLFDVTPSFQSTKSNAPQDNQVKKLPPKCKTRASRKAAFGLLVELVDKCPENFKELLNLVLPFMSNSERHSEWNFTPYYLEKSHLGFVGLKNQGATCYMNSLIQQFYMTIPFRKGLFAVNLDDLSKGNDDNRMLLFQLQNIFGFLQESNKKFIDTRTLCSYYKDIDGNPVNMGQQQDVNEFFNLFTERIESALKDSPQKKLLQNVFGGVIQHQLIYEDQISENPEPFLILSLEIKNKRNILESLELYIKGEWLEGDNKYYSEKLQKYVDAHIRDCIRDLPNVLIIHLKRFEFDFQRMVNVKINDRCEFPIELDMYPYTLEGICEKEGRKTSQKKRNYPSYYKYHLVGVLVHTGSADAGHYYSYIMDRSDPNPDSAKKRWYEFNDSTICSFNLENLEKECFGGYEEIIMKEEGKSTVRQKTYRRNNAYMLFYQRTESLNAEQFDEEPIENTNDEQKDSCNANQCNTDNIQGDILSNNTDNTTATTETETATTGTATTETATIKGENNREDENEKIDEETHSAGDPTTTENSEQSKWKSSSMLALKFLVKLSAKVRSRDAEMKGHVDIPRIVKETVWKDNARFFFDKCLFNSGFDNFMWSLLQCRPQDSNMVQANQTHTNGDKYPKEHLVDELEIFQIGVKFVIDILSHSRETESCHKWFEFLTSILKNQKNPNEVIRISRWMLEAFTDNSIWQSESLLRCPHDFIRNGFMNLLSLCIENLSPLETYDDDYTTSLGQASKTILDQQNVISASENIQNQNLVVVDDAPAVRGEPQDKKDGSCIRRFLDSLFILLNDGRFYYRQVSEIIQLLKNFASLGFNERSFLIDRDLISMLILLLNGESFSSLLRQHHIRQHRQHGAGISVPALNSTTGGNSRFKTGHSASFGRLTLHNFLSIISMLVCTCETAKSEPPNAPPPTMLRSEEYPKKRRELPPSDREKLFNKTFFASLIEEGVNLQAIQNMLVHYSWLNNIISANFASLVCDHLQPSHMIPSYSIFTATSTTTTTSTSVSTPTYQNYFTIMESLVLIEDDVSIQRVNDIFSHLFSNIKKISSIDASLTFSCLKFMCNLAQKSDHAKKWLREHMELIEAICKEHGWSISG